MTGVTGLEKASKKLKKNDLGREPLKLRARALESRGVAQDPSHDYRQ
jgi:hypothetical protein